MKKQLAKNCLTIGKTVLWLDPSDSYYYIGKVTRVEFNFSRKEYVVPWKNIFSGKVITCYYAEEFLIPSSMRVVEGSCDHEKLVDYIKLFMI